jgi:hypothetical protein
LHVSKLVSKPVFQARSYKRPVHTQKAGEMYSLPVKISKNKNLVQYLWDLTMSQRGGGQSAGDNHGGKNSGTPEKIRAGQ